MSEVLWTPHQKQVEALERSEFEILYGGSRGGGKTAAGIAWMAEYNTHPNFRGLVLRRNSEDLKDWIDRANQLYSKMGAVQKGNPAEFHWPSGAVIRTGHLKDSQAYTKYQGHEYHKILIEELTHIPDEKHYIKILSSARSVDPSLKPQVFLTTNPGGPGHMWVKERFVDPAPAKQTIWDITDLPNGEKLRRSRIFIPATMDDNPTLMENDPSYVANIEALRDIDPETYKAWRYGDWNVFAGQVFREFKESTHVLRSTIPSKVYTHVLWLDWGYSENSAHAAYLSAIVERTTRSGEKYNQIITYKEWYDNGIEPREFARDVYKWCRNNDITLSYGVADPAIFSGGQTGRASIATMIEREWDALSGGLWCKLYKGVNSGRNGRINRVGMMHAWMSFNPETNIPYWLVTQDCKNFIRTIPNLTYDEHLIEAYDTGGEDHCLHPNTEVITSEGIKKIKELEGTRGKILTINNVWGDYHSCRITRKNAELVEATFSDGHKLKCTPDHKILTTRGMVEAQDLMGERCISYPAQYRSFLVRDTISAENTTLGKQKRTKDHRDYIELFGNILMAPLNMVFTFITKITIGITIILKTLLRWIHQNTYHTTRVSGQQTKNTWKKLGRKHLSGIDQKRELSGIKNTIKRWRTNFIRSVITKFAISVKTVLKPVLIGLDFVNQLALLNIGVSQGKMILRRNVLYAEIYSAQTNTLEQILVQDHALTKCVGVKKIKEKIDTYDLTVDKYHVFTLSNGVVISNSADSCSYGLERVKFIPVKEGVLNTTPVRPHVRMFDTEGKTIGLDLDKFKEAIKHKRDWRSL